MEVAQGWTLNGASRAGNANFFNKLSTSFAFEGFYIGRVWPIVWWEVELVVT
jgi:hypothetical protein